MVCGCPSTGSADCGSNAASLWRQVHAARSMVAAALPLEWVRGNLPQLAVALIPLTLAQYSPPSAVWPTSVLLRDFHLGMAKWLAEQLRRRETIVGLALGASTPHPLPARAAVPDTPEVQVFQLSISELRAAERQPAPQPSVAPVSLPGGAALRQRKQQALIGLARWLKSHAHLRASTLEDGAPAVALLQWTTPRPTPSKRWNR